MRRKTVSVVMATYNGGKFIGEQLKSLLNQTRLPDEIIISDDRSLDNTAEIIKAIAPFSPVDIKFTRNTSQLGFRDNFLQATLSASGDYIAFCDQDDIWRDDKLEKCAQYFDDQNVALIVHSARLIDSDSNKLGEFSQGIHSTNLRPPLSYDPWSTFWGFSITFRRELLDLASISDRFIDYISPSHYIAHDRWICFLGQMVGTTAEIDEPLVEYRQHPGNIFGHTSPNVGAMNPIKRSVQYIEATKKMLNIADTLPVTTKSFFPLYDRQKCVKFYMKALQQLYARHEVYNGGTTLHSLTSICSTVLRGRYRAVHDDKVRWRSIARDLAFAVFRR